MTDFDLDLRTVEEQMDADQEAEGRVVLGVLDGTTPPAEWTETVVEGSTLVLAVEGDVNELAAGFAGEVREAGGDLLQFREFLIVTPPDVGIDRSRL